MKVSKDGKSKPENPKNYVFIFRAQARQVVADKMRSEEQEKQSKDFKCELCDYITSTSKKHMNTKHMEQK